MSQSVLSLLPYQKAFIADPARVMVGLWCRQAGKDFTTAALAVDDAIATHNAWYIVSVTQRQADETAAKARKIAEAYKRVMRLRGEIELADEQFDDYDAELEESFRFTSRTLHLPGGGKVVALPGRSPDTLAGLSGNVILTEFGLFPSGGYDHWRVVFPLCTRGYRVIVISTPRGRNTKLYDLVQDPETYSIHRVDIQRAVADGLVLRDNRGAPTTIEAFKKLYGDPVGWRREYELEFSGDLEALIPWAQIEAAGSAPATATFDLLEVEHGSNWTTGWFDRLASTAGRLELGWDVARHSDISSLWINASAPRMPSSLRALVLMTKTSFALQREIISGCMQRYRNAVGVGDATGLGMDSNEQLAARFPGRWQPFTFTAGSKREIASLLHTSFSDGTQRIPPAAGETKFIATDLYALQRDPGQSALSVSETPNPLRDDSHCDIAWSGGLSMKARQILAATPFISVS